MQNLSKIGHPTYFLIVKLRRFSKSPTEYNYPIPRRTSLNLDTANQGGSKKKYKNLGTLHVLHVTAIEIEFFKVSSFAELTNFPCRRESRPRRGSCREQKQVGLLTGVPD